MMPYLKTIFVLLSLPISKDLDFIVSEIGQIFGLRMLEIIPPEAVKNRTNLSEKRPICNRRYVNVQKKLYILCVLLLFL